MFKENFIRLCNVKKESPSSVCVKVGITPGTYSRWKETSVPRDATLMRIAEYFNVTVEDLLKKGTSSAPKIENVEFFTTPKEREVISSYRQHPELQPVIDKLLDIPQEDTEEIYVAAESSVINLEENIISEDLARRLIEAPAKDKL